MSIPVFFGDVLVAESGSYSPSASKPAAVVRGWIAAGFPLEVIAPPALSARIPELLRAMAEARCDVVLYQAGADRHVDDPLGGLLTSEELERRDRLVFETARAFGLPVAWNLAGGYQTAPAADLDERIRPVVALHETTMRACVDAYEAVRS